MPESWTLAEHSCSNSSLSGVLPLVEGESKGLRYFLCLSEGQTLGEKHSREAVKDVQVRQIEGGLLFMKETSRGTQAGGEMMSSRCVHQLMSSRCVELTQDHNLGLAGVSSLRPVGCIWLRMAMNVAQS